MRLDHLGLILEVAVTINRLQAADVLLGGHFGGGKADLERPIRLIDQEQILFKKLG